MSFSVWLPALVAIAIFCSRILADEESCPTPPDIPNGRVKVRSRGRAVTFKCNRRYTLLGHTDAVCIGSKWFPPQMPTCIKPGCPFVNRPANGFFQKMHSGAMLVFECFPGHLLHGDGVIICDGTNWNGSVPVCQVPSTPPKTNCQFEEEDLCGWQKFPASTTDWSSQSFPISNSTFGTGPTRSWRNRFLFLESSYATANDSTASIFSPIYSADLSANACVSLRYSMNGVTMGTLNIYQVEEDAETLEEDKLLTSVKGNQGTEWHRLAAPLRTTNATFQIAVEGLIGSGYYLSDMAVDDFRLMSDADECREAINEAGQYRAKPDFLPSPVSCRARCGFELTATLAAEHHWSEGLCNCSPEECLLHSPTTCCADYIEMCHYGKSDEEDYWQTLPFMQQLGLSWTVLAVTVALTLVILGVIIGGLLLNRRCRRRRRRSDGVDGKRLLREPSDRYSDVCYMVDEEEEQIDFRLATVVGDEGDGQAPIIRPRQMTSI